MDDDTRRRRRKPGEATEGVRIIGAEEAEKAIGRDDVARRLPDDAPRFGDRPESPPEDGPRPAIRFPLSAASDPGEVDRPPLVPPPPPGGGTNVTMPHWTEPATGEVPKVFASDDDADDDDLDAWSSFTSSAPRWRGEATAREQEEFDDFSRLADDDTRIGALDSRDRPDPDDFFSFDELDEEPDEEEPYASPPPRPISSDPRRTQAARPTATYERPEGPGRDLPVAFAVGAAFAVIALLFFKLGPKWAVALVAVVIAASAAEFFNAARTGGHQPATLLGICAATSLVLAAYWKGEAAIPLVLFLTVVFGLLWYLAGAGGRERPMGGLGVTLLGVCYVGLLGSFGALILTLPDGVGILLGAILATVGYDLGGFVVGRNAGRQPLSAASPNKTVEGLLGGMVCAVLLAVLVAGRIAPWSGDFIHSVWLGIAVAIAAPLGDLCESLLKRDIGVKDMSDALPGHGGVLDRFDAMLFALPATYYVARILFF